MIQAIGVIIGFCVFTRMLEILTSKKAEPDSILVRIFAILTAIVAAGGTVILIFTGLAIPNFR